MANEQPSNLSAWLRGLPIPWMVGYEVGAADATAQGTLYDQQVDLVKQAVRARFPDYAPVDALPYIGHDRKLIQGYAETDLEFRLRLKSAWDQWELAGTWAELLYQLFWSCGLSSGSTWVVQQNGYAYNLTANPGTTIDPTTLLQVTALGLNYTITYPDPIPWWTFDNRTDLCSRFALVISGALPGTITITGRAIFDGTSNRATATWSGPFDDADYTVLPGMPATTDGSAPYVFADAISKTATSVDVVATAPFTGYVDLLAWVDGDNPFASPSLTTKNLIRKVVSTWKPAKAKFMGVYIVIEGAVWGWPIGTVWGQAGLKWGAGSSLFIAP